MLEQVISGKSDWTVHRFDEFAVNVAERLEPGPDDNDTYVGLEHLDSGSLKVRRWGSEVALKGTKLRMREGDILFARRNAYLKRVAIAPHDGLFSAHGMVLRPKPEIILPEFLPFFMQSDAFMDRAISISAGSLSPTINWGPLAKEEFLLPPLQQQARFIEVLKASSHTVDALFDLATRTEALLGSLILETLEIRGFARSEGYKGRFILRTGEEIYTARSGNGEPNFHDQGDTLFFKVADFNRNMDHRSLGFADTRFNAQENASIRVFPPGTVVFPKRGASIFLNKIGILSHPAALDPNLMALEPNQDQTTAEFLMWFFKGVGLWRFADTTSVPQLNHKHLKPVPVPLPSLAEQKILTAQLSQIADALADTRHRLEQAQQAHIRIREEALDPIRVAQ